MRACLVDFPTAEAMKLELGRSKSVSFTDILGLEQTLPAEELFSLLDGPIQALAEGNMLQILFFALASGGRP